MTRTERERLLDAEFHLATAARYAIEGELDDKALDAICMRIAAGCSLAAAALPA